MKKAIVIGSGVGGLAIAIRLAVKGYEVNLFEKNSYPGGKLSAFEKDGFHFDAGPSLFTQPENIEELFALANEPIEKYFTYAAVGIACKYFYENGRQVNAYTDPQQFASEMQIQLGENPTTITRYLEQSKQLYEKVGTLFIENSLHRRKTWLNRNIGKALSATRPAYLFKTLNDYNQQNFVSPEATQLFNRFATYSGSDPFKAPAMLSLIPHLEQNQGTYYPHGGMISITNALYQLAKDKGVQFHFDSPVQRIIHHEGKVKGVVVDGKNMLANIVVSNADSYFTYQNLLNNKRQANKVIRQQRSSSAVIFYWGINKSFDQLGLHNIFFSKDYRQEFNNIFNKKKPGDDPTIYINITSKMEPAQAPAGKENWFVMANAPANTGQDWETIKASLKTNVISKLNRMLDDDVERLIEVEHTLDPVMIEEQTGSYSGALYGSSSNSKLAAFLRHPNFSRDIKGLYFCGGSVHPGGGIPLCLKSAGIVSELITADTKRQSH